MNKESNALWENIYFWREGQYLKDMKYTGGPAAPIVIIRHQDLPQKRSLAPVNFFCSWQWQKMEKRFKVVKIGLVMGEPSARTAEA